VLNVKKVVIPKFSNEAEEVAWWDAHRSEIEAEIRQQMKQKRSKKDRFEGLAERIAADINEPAEKMTTEERTKADSETRKIATSRR
jgi:predicted metal-dependent hydrolase